MNNEEIEVSLRTEIENYLNTILADMKQEVSQFQEKISAEMERHKAELDNAFKPLLNVSSENQTLDAGFADSVYEHLRQAKDEGAKITAIAMDAAEEMARQDAKDTPSADFALLKNAIKDISGKTSQADILKTLVHHAADFAARGAFFIIKNDHFVGWRTFGRDKPSNEDVVKEVFLPATAVSILGASVKSLEMERGFADSYPEDSVFLDKLGFDETQQKYAFPLVVRSRCVAVLYADKTTNSSQVSVDALESLVRVAGLTVEILASSRGGHPVHTGEPQKAAVKQESFAPVETAKTFEYQPQPETKYEDFQAAPKFEIEPQPKQTFEITPPPQTFEFQANTGSLTPPEVEVETSQPVFSQEVHETESNIQPQEDWAKNEADALSYQEPTDNFKSNDWEVKSLVDNSVNEPANESVKDYQFEGDFQTTSFDAPKVEISKTSFDAPEAFSFQDSYTTKPQIEQLQTGDLTFANSAVFNQATTTRVETAPIATGVVTKKSSRLSERNVDLPIEVSEDERRLHNDARRFARLLVSEIKLYNEQKVTEGRASNDVYDRLREAIDRSREMYDKRVQPNVAEKFDYFHFELVNTLAEGNDGKMGATYPGATV